MPLRSGPTLRFQVHNAGDSFDLHVWPFCPEGRCIGSACVCFDNHRFRTLLQRESLTSIGGARVRPRFSARVQF